MFFHYELLTRRGVFALAWIAGNIKSEVMLRNFIARIVRKNGNHDILGTCNSILNPVVPLALRLRATLLYGVVRIYCIQVEEVAKSAQSSYIRSLDQNSLANLSNVVDGKNSRPDINSLNKKNQNRYNTEASRAINCIDVPTSLITLPKFDEELDQPLYDETIWRDRGIQASTSLIHQSLFDGDEPSLIDIPRFFDVDSSNQSLAEFSVEDFEQMRAASISNRTSVLSGNLEYNLVRANSEHFLDTLIGSQAEGPAAEEVDEAALLQQIDLLGGDYPNYHYNEDYGGGLDVSMIGPDQNETDVSQLMLHGRFGSGILSNDSSMVIAEDSLMGPISKSKSKENKMVCDTEISISKEVLKRTVNKYCNLSQSSATPFQLLQCMSDEDMATRQEISLTMDYGLSGIENSSLSRTLRKELLGISVGDSVHRSDGKVDMFDYGGFDDIRADPIWPLDPDRASNGLLLDEPSPAQQQLEESLIVPAISQDDNQNLSIDSMKQNESMIEELNVFSANASITNTPPVPKQQSRLSAVTQAVFGYIQRVSSSRNTSVSSISRKSSDHNNESIATENSSDSRGTVAFSVLVEGCLRETVAQTMLHILELASNGKVELSQPEYAGDIVIVPTGVHL